MSNSYNKYYFENKKLLWNEIDHIISYNHFLKISVFSVRKVHIKLNYKSLAIKR